MSGSEREDLRQLLARFIEPNEAKEAVRDIERGEELIGRHPAPRPGEETIAAVKARVAAAIRRREAVRRQHRMWAAVGVAAAVVVGVGILASMLNKPTPSPQKMQYAGLIPAAVWESNDVAADDADIAMLTAEVKTIENELVALKLDETNGNGNVAVTDLEMELIEIGGDFWKG